VLRIGASIVQWVKGSGKVFGWGKMLLEHVKRRIHPSVIKLLYYIPIVRVVNKSIGNLDLGLDGNFLVGTKRGLYQIRQGKLNLIVKGHFYGISHENGNIYAFERMVKRGRIIRLRTDSNLKITCANVFLRDLSSGCHQIDVYNGTLYICDTYNNRILEIDPSKRKTKGIYYPLDKLSDGRSSTNYGHLNSIYFQGNEVVALCHNETQKTGRASQILILEKDFSVRERIDTNSGSAHNVIPWHGAFLHCDSMNGYLKLGDKIVFDAGCFTRGLSVTKHHILLGGGEYSKRKAREYGKGYLFVLDKSSFSLVRKFEFPNMIQEIRRLDDVDFAMSQSGYIKM